MGKIGMAFGASIDILKNYIYNLQSWKSFHQTCYIAPDISKQ